jgi:uncharacterized membrane protein
MDGIVLDYRSEAGIIRASDGNRYAFKREDWKSPKDPVTGHKVDFVVEEDNAKEIYLINPSVGTVQSAVSGIGQSEKTIPTVIYACLAASFLYGITMIAGVIAAYVYREGANGTWLRSHYDYQIDIFWKSLIGGVIGVCTIAFFGLGVFVLIGTYVWVIVKIIKGWRALAEGKAIS